jgi:hypothetical protein
MTSVQQPSPPPTTPPTAPPPASKKLGALSLVLSILGILTIIIPIVGLVFGIVALIFASLYLKRNGLSGGFSFIVILLAGFAAFFGAVVLIVFIAYGGELIQQLSM